MKVFYIVDGLRVLTVPEMFVLAAGATTYYGGQFERSVATEAVFELVEAALERLALELHHRLMVVETLLANSRGEITDVEYRCLDIQQGACASNQETQQA